MPWTIEVDDLASASVRSLPDDLRARMVRIGRMLAAHGPQHVGMPHVRHIDGKLWEIRAKGKDGLARAFYMTLTGQRIVILHVFVKKSQQTPPREIATAKERMERYT